MRTTAPQATTPASLPSASVQSMQSTSQATVSAKPGTPQYQRTRRYKPPSATMSNRERARFYRLQNKQHVLELTTTVVSLRDQVQRQKLSAQILRGLFHCGVSRDVRGCILTQLEPFIATPSRHIVLPSFDLQKAKLHDASSYGCGHAPIVQIACELTGKHPATAMEAVYQFIPGNSVLMDMMMHSVVVYPCVVRFFFSAEGLFESADVEIDWINGLLSCLGNLQDVAKVAEPLRDLGDPFVVWKTETTS